MDDKREADAYVSIAVLPLHLLRTYSKTVVSKLCSAHPRGSVDTLL